MPEGDSKTGAPGAILIASNEEDKKEIARLQAEVAKLTTAKKAVEDENEDMKAKIAGIKKGDVENEPSTKVKEQDAKIAQLQARVVEPIINQMLTAKEMTGSTKEELEQEKKRLTAMKMEDVEAEYLGNKKLIAVILSQKIDEESPLIASFEGTFPFNGGNQSLTAKSVSIDDLYGGKTN